MFVLYLFLIFNAAEGKPTLQKVSHCEADANYPLTMKVNVKHSNHGELLDYDGYFRVPWGENSDCTVTLESALDGKHYRKMFSVHEPTACGCVMKYIKPLFSALEERASIKPGICPVPKGNYSGRNFELNLGSLLGPMTVIGNTHVTFKLSHIKTKATMTCLLFEFK